MVHMFILSDFHTVCASSFPALCWGAVPDPRTLDGALGYTLLWPPLSMYMAPGLWHSQSPLRRLGRCADIKWARCPFKTQQKIVKTIAAKTGRSHLDFGRLFCWFSSAWDPFRLQLGENISTSLHQGDKLQPACHPQLLSCRWSNNVQNLEISLSPSLSLV